jgi:hypothetical protein
MNFRGTTDVMSAGYVSTAPLLHHVYKLMAIKKRSSQSPQQKCLDKDHLKCCCWPRLMLPLFAAPFPGASHVPCPQPNPNFTHTSGALCLVKFKHTDHNA